MHTETMTTAIRHWVLGAGLCACLCASAAGASAAATVTFTHTDRYADMPLATAERAQVFKDLSAHFAKLGGQLAPDTVLRVEVLDIDLAGRLDPNFRGGNELRVLRGGADWPRMHLRYTVEKDGRVIASGDDELSDMNYLDHVRRSNSDESLSHEKRMIEEWFKDKIASRFAAH